MTAAGGHGAEEIVADLLFVLCKENCESLYGNVHVCMYDCEYNRRLQ